MEKEKIESMLIDYIDGKLNETERTQIENEIARDKGVLHMYNQLKEVITAMEESEKLEPGAHLKARFNEMLQSEVAAGRGTKTIFFEPMIYRVAAAVALVMAGVAIGFFINKNQQREADLMALKREVEANKQMMLSLIENPQSASKRIQGLNVALGIEKADDEVVRALAKTMNEDENSNVRLAAMEALSKFRDEPAVRKILVEGLSKQTDPVVQIALIQLMVRMKEKGVVKDLERIIDDNKTMKAVKDEAYTGLLKLS